tara:strand:+ start:205 stop:786 length:582 start_codon:yes stop_codon:yes gene_type:complete
MALAYSEISVELREISLRDRPDELYKASSKGTVPVLITSNNTVIDESLDIILWTLKGNNNQTWISENSNEEMNLINQNDTTFKKWLDKYKYHDRHPEKSKEYYREQCQYILFNYEKQLKTTAYLLRDQISIADIAIFPFVRQFANVDYSWFSDNYSHLKTWLESIVASDLFLSVMSKHETWQNEDNPKIVSWK